MEQHNQEIGTRRDLVLYRLETARNDLIRNQGDGVCWLYQCPVEQKNS